MSLDCGFPVVSYLTGEANVTLKIEQEMEIKNGRKGAINLCKLASRASF